MSSLVETATHWGLNGLMGVVCATTRSPEYLVPEKREYLTPQPRKRHLTGWGGASATMQYLGDFCSLV